MSKQRKNRNNESRKIRRFYKNRRLRRKEQTQPKRKLTLIMRKSKFLKRELIFSTCS